ncbi:hypothetical protein [Streptomyces sp. NPDC056672]
MAHPEALGTPLATTAVSSTLPLAHLQQPGSPSPVEEPASAPV